MHAFLVFKCQHQRFVDPTGNGVVIHAFFSLYYGAFTAVISMANQYAWSVHACNSCMILIGVHEMHTYSNAPQFILLAHDPLSSSAYPMMTYTPLVTGNLPKELWLLGDGQQIHNYYVHLLYAYMHNIIG